MAEYAVVPGTKTQTPHRRKTQNTWESGAKRPRRLHSYGASNACWCRRGHEHAVVLCMQDLWADTCHWSRMIRHSCLPGFIRHSPHPCSSLNYALSLLLKGNFELEPHRLLFLLSLLSSSIGIHQIFKGSCRCMALGHTLKQEACGLLVKVIEFAAIERA